MTQAETIYRLLLRLYPEEHRQEYGRLMLLHARDLEQSAREHGRLHLLVLYLRLIADALTGAATERWQALSARSPFQPAPWHAVLLAALPGLWMALTRGYADIITPVFSFNGPIYILLLLLVPPLIWWRTRQVPVWTLIPLGMLVTWLTLSLSFLSASLPGFSRIPGFYPANFILLNLLLAAIFFAIALRVRRPPVAVPLIVGPMFLGVFVLVLYLGQVSHWGGRMLHESLAWTLFEPSLALPLVALGLLVARQHNVLALLVVIGGYALLGDTDYLWGSPLREWPGLPLYLFSLVFLFFVLAPAGLLRAGTRLKKALAFFIPVLLFLTLRIVTLPLLLGHALRTTPGELFISASILLSLILGWILYSHLGRTSIEDLPDIPRVST